jgi:hypothetical protein
MTKAHQGSETSTIVAQPFRERVKQQRRASQQWSLVESRDMFVTFNEGITHTEDA